MPRLPFFKKKDEPAGDPLESLILQERMRVLKRTTLSEAEPIEGKARSTKRHRTRKVGEIFLPDGKTLSCLIHDFSDTGLRLELTEPGDPPDSFRLRVPTLQFDRTVNVKWRSASGLGVGYV
ncbi:MAG: PilZ domain-containing protein [Pseudomonadota bacterium]